MNTVHLCPKCGSGKIEEDELCGRAICMVIACSWEGPINHLIVALPQAPDAQIMEVLSTPDMALGIAQEVSNSYLLALGEKAAQAIGVAMVLSGVVGGNEDPKDLGRIIRAATLAAHKATLTEIEVIQKEKHDGGE